MLSVGIGLAGTGCSMLSKSHVSSTTSQLCTYTVLMGFQNSLQEQYVRMPGLHCLTSSIEIIILGCFIATVRIACLMWGLTRIASMNVGYLVHEQKLPSG